MALIFLMTENGYLRQSDVIHEKFTTRKLRACIFLAEKGTAFLDNPYVEKVFVTVIRHGDYSDDDMQSAEDDDTHLMSLGRDGLLIQPKALLDIINGSSDAAIKIKNFFMPDTANFPCINDSSIDQMVCLLLLLLIIIIIINDYFINSYY